MKFSVRITTDTETPGFIASLGKRPREGEGDLFFDPKGRGATIEEAKKSLLCALFDAGVIQMPDRQPTVRKPKIVEVAPPDAISIVS
jgi:hypothetical protein